MTRFAVALRRISPAVVAAKPTGVASRRCPGPAAGASRSATLAPLANHTCTAIQRAGGSAALIARRKLAPAAENAVLCPALTKVAKAGERVLRAEGTSPVA